METLNFNSQKPLEAKNKLDKTYFKKQKKNIKQQPPSQSSFSKIHAAKRFTQAPQTRLHRILDSLGNVLTPWRLTPCLSDVRIRELSFWRSFLVRIPRFFFGVFFLQIPRLLLGISRVSKEWNFPINLADV